MYRSLALNFEILFVAEKAVLKIEHCKKGERWLNRITRGILFKQKEDRLLMPTLITCLVRLHGQINFK